MSPGWLPMPPASRPIRRSAPVSAATNSNVPFPCTCGSETALASGQPPQPLVFESALPLADTLIRLVHRTLSDADGAGAGVGAGGGVGAGDGAGLGAGVGAGVGAGAAGAGV